MRTRPIVILVCAMSMWALDAHSTPADEGEPDGQAVESASAGPWWSAYVDEGACTASSMGPISFVGSTG